MVQVEVLRVPHVVVQAQTRRIDQERRRRGWSQEQPAAEMASSGCPIQQSAPSKLESGGCLRDLADGPSLMFAAERAREQCDGLMERLIAYSYADSTEMIWDHMDNIFSRHKDRPNPEHSLDYCFAGTSSDACAS